jgi:ATP-dependent RNA helicase MRH4
LSTQVSDEKEWKQRLNPDVPPGGLNQRVAKISPFVLSKHKLTSAKDTGRRKTDSKSNRPSSSRPDFKHMKMQQALAGVSRISRSMASDKIESLSSFEDFELLPAIRKGIVTDVLGELRTVEPTPVQKLVIPTLLEQYKKRDLMDSTTKRLETYLIAAETGSGKTLAYLSPLLDYIKRQELKELEDANQKQALNPPKMMLQDDGLEIPVVEKDSWNGKPRAIILVPTSELVSQVGELVKTLSHTAKFRSAMLSREFSARVIRNRLFGAPVDVVVCTPHLLNSLTSTNPALLSRCSNIVIDEADSLYDRSFSPITSAIVSRCANLERLILCSATIPRSLHKRLHDLYPKMKRLVTPNLHVIPRRIQLQVVDAENDLYHGNKKLACADTLYTIAKDNTEEGYLKKVVVFVNERETTIEVANYLVSKGLDAVAFARDTKDRTEAEAMEMFTGSKQDVHDDVRGKQRMRILVTTDITSRGIDTKTVKNVVLYDMPHSTVDLIHRIGRTGRMGRRGKAVILVDRHSNKGWIKDIKTYAFVFLFSSP